MAGRISWGLDRSHGPVRHAYDTGTGLALCSGTPFHPLPEQHLRAHEQFAAQCRTCRVEAWDRTNPGLTYPSPY